MSSQIFLDLKNKYPKIISQLGRTFTSHEFILKIAQQYQVEYIEVLYLSCNRVHREKRAPFRYVHNQLANLLKGFPELVRKKRGEVDSFDIFGHSNRCVEWEKVGTT